MALLLPVLLVFLLCLTSALYYLGAFRRRRPGEPPLDKGPLPWLGHLLDFRRHPANFLQKMQKKHGNIFTVQFGGRYFTFLMDPLSFGSVIREAEKLDFSIFAEQMVKRVFGYHALEEDHKLALLSTKKHLMGDGLVLMTQAMMTNLQKLMLHGLGSAKGTDPWTEDGLYRFSYNILFRAGFLAIFGTASSESAGTLQKADEQDRLESEELFLEFRKYDQLVSSLAYGVLPPRRKMEAERLKRLFWRVLSVEKVLEKDNTSRWVTEQCQEREELGVRRPMLGRFMLVLLFVSQSNTGPSAFWLLFYLMKHPEAMKAVQEEVDGVLKETGQQVYPGGPPIDLTRDMLLRTPVLDSAVEETLRLTAAPLLTRAVMQDMKLQMADGREFALRKGDWMSLFPYIAAQMDPSVHPEPHTFKYDRFLTPQGTKKTNFYKDGKKLKFYNMPWGAGVSMCPGRFFATNELKQFVFLMLTYFDLELLRPDEEITAADMTRWGIGLTQPTRDVRFRYRLRI
ncbi:CP8B1 hydroxylase, partial [Polypterus senegalus]